MTVHKILQLSRKDFEVQSFCTGGPGGQHQNRNRTGIRVIHKESGLAAESRVHKSQGQNKKEAFRKLAKLLVAKFVTDECESLPRSAVVIRSYNEPDDRVVDHASGEKFSYRQTVGKGDLSGPIEARRRNI